METFFRPGLVVAVPVGPVKHVGIITDCVSPGGPYVISSSQRRRCVSEESLDEFANGGQVEIVGYLGELTPAVVIARARSKLGEKWNLFNANCEHFVNWAHGKEAISPQLRGAAAMLLLVLFGSLALRQS